MTLLTLSGMFPVSSSDLTAPSSLSHSFYVFPSWKNMWVNDEFTQNVPACSTRSGLQTLHETLIYIPAFSSADLNLPHSCVLRRGSTQTHWRYSTLNDQEELDSSSKDAIPHWLPTCNTDSHADGANRKTPVRICSHSRDWKSCKIQHARRCRRVSRLLSTSHALTFYPHTSLFCHIWLSDLVLLTGDGQQHRDVAPEESCNPTQPWCKLKSVTAG